MKSSSKKNISNNWQVHYIGMPEYKNIKKPDPEIIVTFKFRNKNDFDTFHKVIKNQLYNNEKVFDGRQLKNKKSTWFPLNEKARRYRYK